jgi:hypothetical protein
MGKIVFWLVIVFVVLFALRLLNVGKRKARDAASRSAPGVPPASAMVRCVECGVFLPQADARTIPAGFHCGTVNCAQHRPR